MIKKFFILTDIDGVIISEGNEFVNELEAMEWYKAKGIKDRCFLDVVNEIVL
jgi:histidinol phosphatase-like enzyme